MYATYKLFALMAGILTLLVVEPSFAAFTQKISEEVEEDHERHHRNWKE